MKCYIIHPPEGVDEQLLSSLNIKVIDTIDCANCLVAQLEDWQVRELRNAGYILTLDRNCSI